MTLLELTHAEGWSGAGRWHNLTGDAPETSLLVNYCPGWQPRHVTGVFDNIDLSKTGLFKRTNDGWNTMYVLRGDENKYRMFFAHQSERPGHWSDEHNSFVAFNVHPGGKVTDINGDIKKLIFTEDDSITSKDYNQTDSGQRQRVLASGGGVKIGIDPLTAKERLGFLGIALFLQDIDELFIQLFFNRSELNQEMLDRGQKVIDRWTKWHLFFNPEFVGDQFHCCIHRYQLQGVYGIMRFMVRSWLDMVDLNEHAKSKHNSPFGRVIGGKPSRWNNSHTEHNFCELKVAAGKKKLVLFFSKNKKINLFSLTSDILIFLFFSLSRA